MKKSFAIILVIFIMVFSSSCSTMPFNGNIEFHKISLYIPEKFIRDSTQSSKDLWVFEHDNYSEYIIIIRKDLNGDASSTLRNYAEYMKENNVDSSLKPFLNNDAVFSTYYKDDVFCQEVLFAYENSTYAVALRGGNENDFNELLNSIVLTENK